MAGLQADVTAVLKGLEEELLSPRIRKDERRLMELLAEEFREFGSSGRVYTRPQIVETLAGEKPRKIGLEDFAAERLADGCFLVTYRTCGYEDGPIIESLRSSVWIWRDGRWQMLFHQGTRVGGMSG